MKQISIVLGSYNRLKFLKLTIASIRKELEILNLFSEIIVIDGGSNDGSVKWLTKQKDIVTIIQHNRGTWRNKEIQRRSWGYFMNLGFKIAQGKYICMVSDDCLIVPNSLKNGYEFFEEKLKNNEKIGAVAFYWRNAPFFYKDWKTHTTYNVLCNFGKMYLNHGMYLKEALEEINYIDEENYLFYCADVDLCLRLWEKGYQCIAAPNSYVEHYLHATPSVKKGNQQNYDELFLHKRWDEKLNWPKDQNSFGKIEKNFYDKHKTIEQFKKLHFRNLEFWSNFVKTIAKNKTKQILKLFEK